MHTSIGPKALRLGCVVATTLAAVATFPSAVRADDSAQSRLRGPERRALLTRSRALNCLYGRAETCLAPAARRALEMRGAAMNRLYRGSRAGELTRQYDRAATRVTPVAVPSPPTSSSSDGFDWASVAVGAGGAFGVVLVGSTAVVLVRRRHARYA